MGPSHLQIAPKDSPNQGAWESGEKAAELNGSESNPNTLQFSLLWNQILILHHLREDGLIFRSWSSFWLKKLELPLFYVAGFEELKTNFHEIAPSSRIPDGREESDDRVF